MRFSSDTPGVDENTAQNLKSRPGGGSQDLKSSPGASGVDSLKSTPGTGVQSLKSSPGVGTQDLRAAPRGAVENLKGDLDTMRKLQELGNRLYSAANLDDILFQLKDEIMSFFNADRMTVYMVDGVKRELISRYKSGKEISEIRIPISKTSIAGHAAMRQKMINVKDVYDDDELSAIDPDLKFDKNWDVRTGYKTKSVLVYPVIFEKYLLGAIQLINKVDGGVFTPADESSVAELAKMLGIALFNQKRMARATKTHKFDYLLENHLLTQKELTKAIGEARHHKEAIETYLYKVLKIPKKDIGESLSKFYNVPFADYDAKSPIPSDLLVGIKVPFMQKNTWVPLRIEEGEIIIAVDNPHDLQKIDEIKTLFQGKKLRFHVALKEDIQEYISLFTQDDKELAAIDDILLQLQEEAQEIEEAEEGLDEADSAVVQLVNKIVLDAYARNASDIHIEPYPGKLNTQVRFRVDGSCYVYQTIPFNYKNAVISRIKIMADLDIAERRKPQDGKIKFRKYGGKNIELRVATVPTQGGLEDVVLRILAAGEPIPLKDMAFSERNYDEFINCITKPYGIIFVCGPTGSGKTTTLHSALSYINKPETKIWTAEDPVEITQKGLRQVQVKPKIGLDFAACMRSFLRADPDVIMVGEMRDKETTHIGIEASLTGHLVFSTLHTNSAPESITRLLDMGMDPFNFADAILCIQAQRLVRTLCRSCKKPYTPSEDQYQELVREYGGEEMFMENVNIPYSKELKLYQPSGCDECHQTGYAGRMAIHELLVGTDEIKRMIQTQETVEHLRIQAIKDGMTTLKQDGIEKIFLGHTDLINVRKVTIK